MEHIRNCLLIKQEIKVKKKFRVHIHLDSTLVYVLKVHWYSIDKGIIMHTPLFIYIYPMVQDLSCKKKKDKQVLFIYISSRPTTVVYDYFYLFGKFKCMYVCYRDTGIYDLLNNKECVGVQRIFIDISSRYFIIELCNKIDFCIRSVQ